MWLSNHCRFFVVKAYIANPSCCGVLTMPMSKWTSEEGRAFLGDSGRFRGQVRSSGGPRGLCRRTTYFAMISTQLRKGKQCDLPPYRGDACPEPRSSMGLPTFITSSTYESSES